MSGKNESSDLIERYFGGLLDQEERVRFEQKMEQDPDFRKEVELFRLSEKMIIQNRLGKVFEKIKQKEIEIKEKKPEKPIIKKWWLLLLPAILIIYSVSYFSSKVEESDKPVSHKIIIQSKEDPVGKTSEKPADTLTKPTHKRDQEISSKKTDTQFLEIKKDTSDFLSNENSDLKLKEKNLLKHQENIDSGNYGEDTIVQENVIPVKINPCEGVVINTEFNHVKPCKGERSGSISVEKISGGNPPFSFYLNNDQQNNQGFFYNLPGGKYDIEIIDAKGCKTVIDPIVLEEKTCRVDLFFSPVSGETLLLPVSDKAGVITIMNKEGNIYFQYSLQEDEHYYWNGYSEHGANETGYFPFYIKYSDGTLLQGSITIAP